MSEKIDGMPPVSGIGLMGDHLKLWQAHKKLAGYCKRLLEMMDGSTDVLRLYANAAHRERLKKVDEELNEIRKYLSEAIQ